MTRFFRRLADAIETGLDSDNFATNIAALLLGASLIVGTITTVILAGVFIGTRLGIMGAVLYGAGVITAALKLLEHLIVKEDQ